MMKSFFDDGRFAASHHVQARLNDDGKTWYLNEYWWDEEAQIMRRRTLADGLSRHDAETLVKKGNQFFFLVAFAGKAGAA